MNPQVSSGWNRSWILGGIAGVVMALGAVRVWQLTRPPPEPMGPLDLMIKAMPTDPTSQALARQAAEEAVRLLGDAGGRVVLVIPVPRELHHSTYGAAYESGLRAGLKGHPAVRLEGIYFAAPPYKGNDHRDDRAPTLARLQDVRKNHPRAEVLVSFLGLPQMTPAEQKTWMASHPPRMVAVEMVPSGNDQAARQALEAGLVDALVVNARPERQENLIPLPNRESPASPPPRFHVLRKP